MPQHFPTTNHPHSLHCTHHTCDTPHRLTSPLLPHPSGWPKIFFSFSLRSFIKLIKYDASIASNIAPMIQLNHAAKVTQNFNSPINHVTFSFVFVTFRRFFYIFSRYISSISPFYPKNSRLQASTTAYPLATGTTLSLTEILLRLAGEVARRAGGVSHAQE